jgi:hypothetical protein
MTVGVGVKTVWGLIRSMASYPRAEDVPPRHNFGFEIPRNAVPPPDSSFLVVGLHSLCDQPKVAPRITASFNTLQYIDQSAKDP